MDLLVELVVSWLVLWLAQKKGLSELGMLPNRTRILQLLIGFSGACLLCGFNLFLQTIFSGSHWMWNKALTLQSTLASVWWILHSVLYEELIFRGALLYVAIQKVGLKKACILSASTFGIYHWFSMNAFGQWLQMSYLFVANGKVQRFCLGLCQDKIVVPSHWHPFRLELSKYLRFFTRSFRESALNSTGRRTI